MNDLRVFDIPGALDRVCGDTELLHELYGMLKDQANHAIPEIHSLIQSSDLSNTSKCAHSLKSALGNLGACSAHAVANDLERAAKNGDSAKAETLVRILEGEIESFFSAYQKFKGDQNSI